MASVNDVTGDQGEIPAYTDDATGFVAFWRQAGRAKSWKELTPVNLLAFWLLQAGTALALFWVIRFLLRSIMGLTNDLLVFLPFSEPWQFLYTDPTQLLLGTGVLCIGVSPWLLDGLLSYFYGRQNLTLESLTTYSPEGIRVLQRHSRQRGCLMPKLGILPFKAPIVLTYGNLPRTARIFVTQGLLEQLADDEIATIYASQLAHIKQWDFVVMSLVLLMSLLPYLIYQQFSEWGNAVDVKRQAAIGTKNFYFLTLIFFLAVAIASIAYLVWCLLTGTALCLSQLRLYLSDRYAMQITGNPNALTRALLKMAMGIARDIEKQGQTSWQLESLNILNYIGYQQAVSIGSLPRDISWETLLVWDYLNPRRYLFVINSTHPLMGDRLQRMCQVAKKWHLDPELNLASPPSSSKKSNKQNRILSVLALREGDKSAWLQIAPFLGIPLGLALAAALWLIWQIAFALEWLNLKWIYDNWSFSEGCLLIGFSIGTFIRINTMFPDIKNATVQSELNLGKILSDSTALPINSYSVSLQGKLLGRRGVYNWLGQDLIWQSTQGLVKLHHIPLPFGSLSPWHWIERRVILTGWLRRGATTWLDIESLRISGKTIHGTHPLLSTILASAAAAWGSYILFKNN
jgi:Zn-dependent protease with chaperone function